MRNAIGFYFSSMDTAEDFFKKASYDYERYYKSGNEYDAFNVIVTLRHLGERVKSFAKNKDGSPNKRYEQLSRLYSKQEKAFDNFLNGDNIDFNSKKYSHYLGLIREFCNSAKYYE